MHTVYTKILQIDPIHCGGHVAAILENNVVIVEDTTGCTSQ